ncbi:hypothetical protein SLEP1_g52762 [Rubroshorea leprosula]|uniref:Uncharacterized protein n=1 Tax=Rubroshorea leprosula TaxID=152421 RepID=A0AAV5M829_9ROSI|nr:hypothetical protein SLEP1_g52762 [Rubroshorea leprosula]
MESSLLPIEGSIAFEEEFQKIQASRPDVYLSDKVKLSESYSAYLQTSRSFTSNIIKNIFS